MSNGLKWTAAQVAAKQKKYAVVIGIDTGKNTGFACKMYGLWYGIETLTIYKAIKQIEQTQQWCKEQGVEMFVRIEDARKRTWFGNTGKERLKGAGSVERDCAIWEEVLTDLGIPFEMVHPKEVKETTAAYFAKLTGWEGRTSKHSREAAWLIL